MSKPAARLSSARTRSANSGWVLSPVPVAVPPSGIWATCGSALRDALGAEPDLRRVAAELLAERDRHRVHQVGAAGLDDVVELLAPWPRARASSCSSAGSRSLVASSSAARWTAEGKTSLEDWPMFTWSLGWAPSPARLAMTSLAFMFDEVPGAGLEGVDRELVVELAGGDAVGGVGDAARESGSSSPSSALTRAAAPLMRASQRTTSSRTGMPGDREVLNRLGGLPAPELLFVFDRHVLEGTCEPAARLGVRPP